MRHRNEAKDRPSYPPGVQPYDRLNGVRIGAFTGGIIGILGALVLSPPIVWVLGGVIVGGLGGYFWQRREEERRVGGNGVPEGP